MTISCIHPGKKTILAILYMGKPKNLSACVECVIVITSSDLCEVIPQ